ncbi:MAG: O-antigen ligase family protein [Firmicutes bacterium]|nr:O-antigen ligase family protein [Bacillota bacterium]
MQTLKNSFVIKSITAVWSFLAAAYDHSLLARIFRGLSRAYEGSALRRLWEGFYSRKDPAEYSVYGRFLRLLEAIMLSIGRVVQKSVFFKILMKLKAFYFKASEGSRILSAVNKLSLRRWMFIVFAAYLPVEYVLRDVLSIGLASYWEELFIMAAAALVIWRSFFEEHKGTLSRASSVEAAMILFMMVGLLLMLLNRPYPYIAVAGYRAQVEYMVWFMFILRLIDSREDARFLIFSVMTVIFLLSFHGIYQFIVKVPIPDSWMSATESAVRTRVFSICGSPNIFGCMLMMSAPIAASLIYYCRKTWHKLFFLCVTGILCLCDLFTFSKGSWVGLVVAVILFSVFVDKRLIALMGVGVSAILVAVPSITNRIAYLFTSEYAERSSLAGRSMRWRFGLNLLRFNNKWLGYGLGRFGGAVAMNNQVQDKIDGFTYFYMDNYYMKTLVEMGIIGLIFFILLLVVLLIAGFRSAGRCGRELPSDRVLDPLVRNAGNDRIICAGVLSGLCGVLVHCYYENIFEEPYMMAYFWGLAAALLYLGLYAPAQGKKAEETDEQRS